MNLQRNSRSAGVLAGWPAAVSAALSGGADAAGPAAETAALHPTANGQQPTANRPGGGA